MPEPPASTGPHDVGLGCAGLRTALKPQNPIETDPAAPAMSPASPRHRAAALQITQIFIGVDSRSYRLALLVMAYEVRYSRST
jgi:hypothetical protein